jgi:hypothetical protein
MDGVMMAAEAGSPRFLQRWTGFAVPIYAGSPGGARRRGMRIFPDDFGGRVWRRPPNLRKKRAGEEYWMSTIHKRELVNANLPEFSNGGGTPRDRGAVAAFPEPRHLPKTTNKRATAVVSPAAVRCLTAGCRTRESGSTNTNTLKRFALETQRTQSKESFASFASLRRVPERKESMRFKEGITYGVGRHQDGASTTRRKRRAGRVAPRRWRTLAGRCACGQVADHKTKSGWVCLRCLALENRGYDRFTGVLRRQTAGEGEASHDHGQ